MSVNVKENGSLTRVGGLYHDTTLGQELDEFNTSTADMADGDYIITKSNNIWYRKALSKVWDYISGKLGIASSGDTFLKKDGTWATPANDKVAQEANTSNSEYKVLLSGTNSDASETTTAKKYVGFTFNPSSAVLTLARDHNSTSTQSSMFTLGNDIADGTSKSAYGQLRIYGKGQYRTNIMDTNNVLTASRSIYVPNRSGYIATTNMAATDESAPATVDNVTAKRADRAYSTGEHFIIDNQFCTATADIASGAILTENTNYVTGTIADYLTVKTGTMTIPSAVSSWCEFTGTSGNKLIFRQGNIVKVNTIVKITDMPTLSAAAFILELPWENSQGVAVFGQLNAYGQPYTMRTEAVYIGSGTTNKNKVGIRSSLPNGSYYVSIQYMTNDPF